MATLILESISKSFDRIEAVKDVSLNIDDREFVVFVGPSGCGKSTLLRIIAGLERASSGSLRIGGKVMNDVPAADRGIAMVFQSYALYPHMNVAQNMGFGLRMSGVPASEVARKVNEAAGVLQIEDLLTRRPRELSGGQRQRVAIGRAIVRSPDVFLFDEPLSNLDADLRSQMRVEISRLHGDLNTTVVYVTHDQVEAMTMADRIVVLNKGVIEQVGTPAELYDRPRNVFVAGFLGQPKMNFIPARIVGSGANSRLRLPSGDEIQSPMPGSEPAGDGAITVGLRPDAVSVGEKRKAPGIQVTLELSEQLGSEALLHVRMAQLDRLLTFSFRGKSRWPLGENLTVQFDPQSLHLFDQSGLRLDPGPSA